MDETAIVWFRNDLRLHDNYTLSAASKKYRLLPVYVFDPRSYRPLDDLEFLKTGTFKTRFLIESVENLRKNLQLHDLDLVIKIGKPEEELGLLADEIGAKALYATKEITTEEVEIEERLEKSLFSKGIRLELIWQLSMMHPEDIPWPSNTVPEVFTDFRKEAEKTVEIRPAIEFAEAIMADYQSDLGKLPTLEGFGLSEPSFDDRSVMKFKGGEDEGMQRLEDYLWKDDLLKTYKETRNELIGADFSSKLSPWLAVGALSPRQVYFEIKRYEKERVKNESTYWLFFELLWRDFFKFMAKKHGRSIFLQNGFSNNDLDQKDDREKFETWKMGETGEPFIDANMNELRLSGYMSNRGRQIVASYLMHNLNVNWTWGAAWFEHCLIDYDPASNWLNWAYIAGVGNDPRNGRVFDVESQQQRHDPNMEYRKLWA